MMAAIHACTYRPALCAQAFGLGQKSG